MVTARKTATETNSTTPSVKAMKTRMMATSGERGADATSGVAAVRDLLGRQCAGNVPDKPLAVLLAGLRVSPGATQAVSETRTVVRQDADEAAGHQVRALH
jgi:hypothetical protein